MLRSGSARCPAPPVEPTMRELWAFLRTRKKWWLAPLLVAMLLLALLMVFAEGSGAGPLIYTLF